MNIFAKLAPEVPTETLSSTT